MESVKKWLSDRNSVKKNGIYVHYSPPKMLGPAPSAQLRAWLRDDAAAPLERAVLAGQGARVLAQGAAGAAAGALGGAGGRLGALVAACAALHAAVERGSLAELQVALEAQPARRRRRLAACRDAGGAGLLHKAAHFDYLDIVEWLVGCYPELVLQRDSEGRTPLHYARGAAAALLEGAGAARGARDSLGHSPAFYRRGTRALLPAADDMPRDARDKPAGLVIKRHNIRIWCHDCDMARLQRVVWAGHGARLLSEVSNQPAVKRFLEAVPYIMNTIRDIHKAVIENNLEELMRLSGDPVPPLALSSRDKNNCTVLHKAAGLGHAGVVQYLAARYPAGLADADDEGRTPLHYAAAVRDEQHLYDTLVASGADESVADNKNKTPAYYLNRPQEIDKNILKTLPDAPRTPSTVYPASWDWRLLDAELLPELNKKPKRKHKGTNDNSNTITASESTREPVVGAMKASSTHELIKGLPDLEEQMKNVRKSRENLLQGSQSPENIIKPEDNPAASTDHEEINEREETDIPGNSAITEDYPTTNKELQDSNEYDVEENETNKVEATENIDVTNIDQEQNEEVKTPDNELLIGEDTESEKRQDNHSQKDENDGDNKSAQFIENQPIKVTNDSKSNEENKIVDENSHDNKKEDEKNGANVNNDNADHEISVKSGDNEEKILNQNSIEVKEEQISRISSAKLQEEMKPSTSEGNKEDDDDVKVQGESQSEYSDFNLQSTAEASDTHTPDTGSAKRGHQNNGRSTQESLIEGLVSGEAEADSQDAIIDEPIEGHAQNIENEIDPEVGQLVNSVNMEMLAALVLNGEGARLVGRRSTNAELQAFLDNVPTYMKKIHNIHIAAREGNIKDLQAALDRRKFAIARDSVSPNGATPLHVATIFGKTNIMKYLGGRFPETLSAVDFEGRTALHYAAVLPDNGYYYNMLQQIGANSKDLDDSGRSAEEYREDPKLLPFEQLVSDFGVTEEVLQDMLSDKVPDDRVSSRRTLDAAESLETLERCWRLLASARAERAQRSAISASSNRAAPPAFLGRFLKRPTFDAIKTRTTKLGHDLFDVIWPAVKKLPDNRNIVQSVEEDFPGGVTIPDYNAHLVFHEFFQPFVKDFHNMNVNHELKMHPQSDYVNSEIDLSNSSEPLVELNVDPNENYVLSGTMECMRNLKGFELPLNLSIGQLEETEQIVTNALLAEEFYKLIKTKNGEADQKTGTYYTLSEVLEKPSEICATLASDGLLIALCDREDMDDPPRLHGKLWPYGRGVFVSDDKTLTVWVNVHDHIRVVMTTPSDAPGEIGLTYSRLSVIMVYLHQRLKFEWDPYMGHLSRRPNFFGTGVRFSLTIHFPGLSKDLDNLKYLCAMRGLQYRETLSPDIARVCNYQTLGINESNCFNDFSTAISNILHLEADLSMSNNSTQIAALLTNIFKRKRSSLAEQGSPSKY